MFESEHEPVISKSTALHAGELPSWKKGHRTLLPNAEWAPKHGISDLSGTATSSDVTTGSQAAFTFLSVLCKDKHTGRCFVIVQITS